MRILVTGGAGYIGSHTCLELLNCGYEVVVIDNLCNSSFESLERVMSITGKKLSFYNVDLLDIDNLNRVFDELDIYAVIHFAGLKAVGESSKIPLEYYKNNITGTLNLCEVMLKHSVNNIIFSSSATVYGDPDVVPITESSSLSATNPYGRTKLFLEQILEDIGNSNEDFNVILLRYFNPIGAHESGLIGEDPKGIPNNLLPYISQVASGKLPHLNIFGNDYNTHDGTGVRDYIHVVDLAIGHIKALEKIKEKPSFEVYNLGTGKGYSVLDIVKAYEHASGIKIPYKIAPRRKGDIAVCYADPQKALKQLNFSTTKDLKTMCKDSFNWQSKNPNGYEK